MKKEVLDFLSKVTDEETAFLDGANDINRNLYMKGDADVINAKKLVEIGKFITIRPHTRFIHFPEHTHDYIEMIYMCKGETTHIINGKSITLLQGETLILNQHAHQEILPAKEGDLAVNFIIMPQFFGKALEMMGEEETPLRRFIIDCIAGRENTDGYLYFKTSDVLQIQNLFENLILSFVEKSSGKRKINEFTMGLLLLEFINHSDKIVYKTKEKSVVPQMLKYIEENYQSGSLGEIAERLHYDLYWLSREIKRKTGKTFTELLQEKRLSQAEYLLVNSNMKVSDVATSVGYNNMSYFHKIFEERFGTSPKKYRDKLLFMRQSRINNIDINL
ncbi:MAG: helix-turn-helix domain-containing protein [Clostridia bacterium]|nr:helix-turn-helix domain-containing protein [Clostridia bacterium]